MLLSKLYKKHRKSILIASTVVSVIGLAVIGILAYREFFLSAPVNVASWFDDNWEQRKAIDISNDSGGDLTNEHVLVEIDTATLIGAGKLQADCDDIRFVDGDDNSLLNYWIEGGCNTAGTQVWVNVPSLPSAGKTIYVYYGNGSAINAEQTWGGDTYIYSDTTCPSGWTRVAAADDKFLYGSATAGNTGGSSTHSHDNLLATSTSISTTNISGFSTGTNNGGTSTHQHDNLKATFDDASSIPEYSSMVLCSKNTFTLPASSVAIFKTLPATNWTRFSTLDGIFPMADETAGTTGGSDTHSHSLTTSFVTGIASASESNGPASATGGTETTDGGYTYHTFTSSGTFTPSGSLNVEILVVGGGGAGGNDTGGGGGAGGLIHNTGVVVSSPVSVTVGAGGSSSNGYNGGNSSFGAIVATGGGAGASGGHSSRVHVGQNGGSGGGGLWDNSAAGSGISGQGYNGYRGTSEWSSMGGGGAGEVGQGRDGGDGQSIWGTYYAGGGAGCKFYSHSQWAYGVGGLGGGGSAPAGAGTNGLGGGGAGDGYKGVGAAGGSGVVKVRYTSSSATGTITSNDHTHTSTSGSATDGSSVPPYVEVIFGKSTVEEYIPNDIVLPVTELPPLGWSRVTALDDKFTIGSTSYGTTGGNATHTHDVSISTGGPSSTLSSYGSGYNFADSTHTHSCSDEGSSATQNLPPYMSVIYAERTVSQSVVLGEEERPVPDAPTIGVPQALSTTSIRWVFTDNSDDELGFKIYDEANNLMVTCATPNMSYCDETGLSPNTQYTRKVVAYNASGDGDPSATASAFTQTSIPTISYGGSKTVDSIGLTGGGQVDGSELYYDCTGAGCDTGLNLWTLSTSATATGLDYNTGYDFQIKGRNGDDVETDYSGSLSIYTLAAVPTLASNTVTDTTISLTASNVRNLSLGSSGLYFECTGESCSTGINEWINTDTDVVTSLLPNTEYTFRAKTRNFDGTETTYSSTLDKYTLAVVPTITAEAIGSTEIQLTGGNIANLGLDSSAIYFECTGENCNTGISEWTANTTDNVTGLQPNTQYTFRVKARNGEGVETNYSDTVSVYTQSETPILSASVLSDSSVELTAGNIGTLGEGQSAIYFECTVDNCDTGLEEWILTDTDIVTGLQSNTEYTFRVKARNYDGTETGYSGTASIYTHASVPTVTGSSLSSSSINVTANGINNLGIGSSAVYFECITDNCSEGLNEWIASPTDAVTSLSGNSMYSIRVKARNADGIETTFSDSTGIYTQANIPTISANAESSTSISLTAGNTHNINLGDSGIYFECVGESCATGIENWIQTDTDTVSELSPNTEYTYRVRARNYDSIQTDYSSNISKYTLAEVPGVLSLDSNTDTEVALNLGEDNNPDSTEYLIQESVTGKYYNDVADELQIAEKWISKDTLASGMSIEDLTAGTNYTFRIKARNAENVATDYTETLSIYTKLLTPTSGIAQVDSSTAITWNFTDTNSMETGFKVYDRGGNLVATCQGENLAFCQETGLSPNTTYQRKITAYNLNTESNYSTVITGTTLSNQSSISSITTVDGDTVVLNINAGSNDDIQIYESSTDSYYNPDLQVLTSSQGILDYSSSITVDGLEPDTTYSFRIRSQNSADIFTGWSDYVTVLTRAHTPSISNLNKLDVDTVRVFVNGGDNPSTTQYLVQEMGSGQYLDYSTNTLVDGEVWGTLTQFGSVNGILVNGLEGEGQYGFRVMSRNSDNVRSVFSQAEYVGTKSVIINVPEGMKATLTTNEETDLTLEANAQLGEHDVRIKQEDYLVADIPISFLQDRDWEGVVLEFAPQVHKTVIKLEEEHGVAGSFTMYVSKGDTNALRICPDAVDLSGVVEGCNGEAVFMGEFPQTGTVEGNEVAVSQVILGGVKYWVADGLVGTGGEGFFVEDEPVVTQEEEEGEDEETTFASILTQPVKMVTNLSEGVVKALDDTPLKDLKENELQTVVATTTVVTVAVGTTAGLGGISQLAYLIGQLFSGLLSALGLKRKKLTYGFIYDSYTKQPIPMAMIRIFNMEGDLVESSVTDSHGRFRGALKEGIYTLEISKRGYVFPTKFLKGIDDYPLPKIYKGGKFTISKGEDINLVIPVDSKDLTSKEKVLTVLKGFFNTVFGIFSLLVFIGGVGIAVYMYENYPTWQNLVISLVYIPSFFILISTFIKKGSKYGVVKNEKGKALSGIEVGLKESEFNTLIQKRITDDKGRYNFVVDKGEYEVVLLNDKFVITNVKGGRKIFARKEDTIIKKKIVIKRK